jgi:hypothetical protein
MKSLLSLGHRFTVGFLALCCALGISNVLYGLILMKEDTLIFAGAQAIFALFTGAAAWNVYQWRPTGRFLALFVVLQWASALVNFRGRPQLFTLVMTIPVVVMYLWLRRQDVKTRFKAENSPI